MKFYISTSGIKRVTISNSTAGGGGGGKGSAAHRRVPIRTLLPVVVVLGILLPLFFVRVAFLVLESAAVDCLGWRYFGGMDTSVRLRQELTRALVEANEGGNNDHVTQNEAPINSFSELVKEMTSRQDIKGFALRTKAMLADMEHKIQSARQRELVFWHFASHGVPKSLHCLYLRLTEEYAVNAKARSRLPPPEFMSCLTDPSFHHIVLLTDNVLAASVVVSSTVKNTVNPEKLVFHVVTDKKTYTSMHAWFSINPIRSAIVEVKGLHQFDWSHKVNVGVKEMLEIHQLIWSHYYNRLKKDLQHEHVLVRNLEVLSPHYLSLLNHLRIYIPELFPKLDKIIFLDDDVVVQKDITALSVLHLNEKVAGAVVGSWCGKNCCPGRKYKDYFNFSHPTISYLDGDRCAWHYGMVVFDLAAWRRSNITKNYHRWLKQSLNSGFELWQPGVLPPALLAFEGHVHPIHPSWLMSGLGQYPLNASIENLQDAAILHYSGPAKPWLDISFPEIRILWTRHVNFSNKFIRTCRITG